jgi:phage replication initiation protein
MTRPGQSALVLDGSEVKLRLEAERALTKSPVHIDWVRFTTLRRKAPMVSADLLFSPIVKPDAFASIWDEDYRAAQVRQVLAGLPDGDFDASVQALELAREVCAVLGEGFMVAPEVRKGHDFYRCRWGIERNGSECAWVGFLSSGDSPRQAAQSRTIHVNVFGSACTFGDAGWAERMADLVDSRDGDLTRCDLALDFFDGIAGGMDGIKADYMAGLCKVGGRQLKCNMLGDWANGHERSFYIGSKEAGKQTNIYEKGDQLFGVESGSAWMRCELRYGNKLRVLSADMLRRPADFFAGASDWHALMLRRCDEASVVCPAAVPVEARLAIQTVLAEVTRNVRWTLQTAAASVAALFEFAEYESCSEVLLNKKLPGRLSKFAPSELRQAFVSVFSSTVGSVGPAFV